MMTSAQIVALALQIAKVPGYTTQGGQALNMALMDLAIDNNLDIIRRTTSISVIPGTVSYALPANFLRAREVFYYVDGVSFYLVPISMPEYDQLYTGPSQTSYPDRYAIDQATNLIYLYPMPFLGLTLELRYMDSAVEITNPETSSVIPWFPKQDTLVTMTAERVMRITDDTRQGQFYAMADESTRRYLKLTNGTTLKTVQLDGRRFRGAGSQRPTKLYP